MNSIGSNPELAAAREALSTEQQARQSAEAREHTAMLGIELNTELAKAGLIDPHDSAKILRDGLKWDGGKVVSTDGSKSLSQVVSEYASAKPWLVRAEVRPGTGAFPSAQTQPVEKFNLADYFGPTSNGDLVNRLARSDPKTYKALRIRAQKAGLVR